MEHGINKDGTISEKFKNKAEAESASTFFVRTKGNKFVPRSVLVDLEPSVIDEIKTGEFSKLFHPAQMITGKEDAANNYARGHYTVGKDILNKVTDSIRGLTEQCDSLQGMA